MATSRYTADIDLEDVNDSHSLAVLQVTPGSEVLDIGAADGSVARRLVERGCRVVGIEADPESARAAELVCERVLSADVEKLDLEEALEGAQFDFVLLLDVLEHLRDPLVTLKAAVARLKPGGRVIVSVPNVTHAALRLRLLGGRFEYTETGLLDRTHLRFFDRPGLEQLVRQAGLTVVERMRISAGLTETEISIDPAEFPPETVELALAGEDADTYQFVYALSTEPPRLLGAETMSLGEALQRRVSEAERLRQEGETYARTLERRVQELEDADARVSSLEEELKDRMDELERVHDQLRHAKMDIAIKESQLAHAQAELAPFRTRLDRVEERLGSALERLKYRVGSVTNRLPFLHRLLRRVFNGIVDRR